MKPESKEGLIKYFLPKFKQVVGHTFLESKDHEWVTNGVWLLKKRLFSPLETETMRDAAQRVDDITTDSIQSVLDFEKNSAPDEFGDVLSMHEPPYVTLENSKQKYDATIIAFIFHRLKPLGEITLASHADGYLFFYVGITSQQHELVGVLRHYKPSNG